METRTAEPTFVVREDAAGNFHGSPRCEIASGWLEEEEGLLGGSVVQLLNVLGIIPANSHNLYGGV